jgi:hypothetical protein
MFPFPFSFFGGVSGPPELELIDNDFSMEFNGMDEYINTSATPAALGLPATTVSGDSFSISLWYNHSTLTNGPPIIQSTTNYAWNDGFAIKQEVALGQDRLRFWVGAQATHVATGNLNASQWYHVVAVFTGGATHNLKIYVDKVLGANADQSFTTSRNIHNPTPISMAWAPDGYGYFYDGMLDEVAIWTRALDATEVETIYDSTNDNPGKCANLFTGGLGTDLVFWNRMGD